MSLAALTLVVISSLGWAGLDALRKSLAHRMKAEVVIVWLMGLQGLGFATWALIAGAGLPPAGYLAPGAAILALNIISNTMFIHAVRVSPLSLTIPLLSLTPVFTALFAMPIAHEQPSERQAAGIAIVVVGALLLGADRAEGHPGVVGLMKGLVRERGSLLMAGVALIWSLVAPLDKLALSTTALPTHAAIQTLGMSLGLALYLMIKGEGAALAAGWAHRRRVAGAAAVAALALGCQFMAYPLTLVSLVEAVKRVIGLALAVALGRLFFQERITAAKLGAVALMAAGTALILL